MNKTDALIIGAGPTGLFTAHQLKLIGLDCEIVDNLDKIGGQCIELYPDKPIYDIPGVPNQTAREHIDSLLKQIKPFNPTFHLNETVTTLLQDRSEGGIRDSKFTLMTTGHKKFITSNVIIAGGAGTFKPKKPEIEGLEELEGGDASVREFLIKDKNGMVGRKLKDLGIPDNTLIAMINRDGEALFPDAESILESGDHVLVFTLKNQLPEVEDFFH